MFHGANVANGVDTKEPKERVQEISRYKGAKQFANSASRIYFDTQKKSLQIGKRPRSKIKKNWNPSLI